MNAYAQLKEKLAAQSKEIQAALIKLKNKTPAEIKSFIENKIFVENDIVEELYPLLEKEYCRGELRDLQYILYTELERFILEHYTENEKPIYTVDINYGYEIDQWVYQEWQEHCTQMSYENWAKNSNCDSYLEYLSDLEQTFENDENVPVYFDSLADAKFYAYEYAVDNEESYTILVNEKGMAKIKAQLKEHYRNFDLLLDDAFYAWAADIEDNMAEGQWAACEIKQHDTHSGHIEYITLADDEWDVVEGN